MAPDLIPEAWARDFLAYQTERLTAVADSFARRIRPEPDTNIRRALKIAGAAAVEAALTDSTPDPRWPPKQRACFRAIAKGRRAKQMAALGASVSDESA